MISPLKSIKLLNEYYDKKIVIKKIDKVKEFNENEKRILTDYSVQE